MPLYFFNHPKLGKGAIECDWREISDFFIDENGQRRPHSFVKRYDSLGDLRDDQGDHSINLINVSSLPKLGSTVKVNNYKPSTTVTPSVDTNALKQQILDQQNGQGHLLILPFKSMANILDRYNIYDIKILAVKSPGKSQGSLTKYGAVHAEMLAPSLDLFLNSERWKSGNLNIQELQFLEHIVYVGEESDRWWALYKPQFINEMRLRPDMIQALDRLKQRLLEGKNVMLMCFCPDWRKCHTGLIGLEMMSQGFIVQFGEQSLKYLMQDDSKAVKPKR